MDNNSVIERVDLKFYKILLLLNNAHLILWYMGTWHNDDGICKIAPLIFCFLVDSSASGILNYIHQVTSKRQRWPDVSFICISNEYLSTAS